MEINMACWLKDTICVVGRMKFLPSTQVETQALHALSNSTSASLHCHVYQQRNRVRDEDEMLPTLS
ncbi:hypothetical protein DNTS_024938 [Danionella cerebrum]|uniref:Uncharacterized protein n=1 Tax=Danionella cerebrum TaxID=2873325 RepID=A0A553MVY3_9TELE|nr:hypothetical protein DNTS_024938 [Danionella translucida]TRY57344.1 hypothetical protein DNTS_024938 [Danionella translucida]